MTTDQRIIFERMKRKLEVMRIEAKNTNSKVYYDVGELLSLADQFERVGVKL